MLKGTLVGPADILEWWNTIPISLKAVAGAAAGTMFGAWLTARAQNKRELVAELRALRSLHALCLVIANQCLAVKRQQLVPLTQAYTQARQDFDLYLAGPKVVPFNILFEFHALPQINAPISAAEKLAFEKCDLGAKGLAATAALRSSIDGLNNTLESRNELLNELRSNSALSDQDILFRYFGLRDPATRRVDERYSSMVQALELQANDSLFFTRQLAAECLRHANVRAKKNRWKYKLPYKRIDPADWSIAIKEGLLPLDDEYAGWLRGFREEPPSWWRRIFTISPPARNDAPIVNQ